MACQEFVGLPEPFDVSSRILQHSIHDSSRTLPGLSRNSMGPLAECLGDLSGIASAGFPATVFHQRAKSNEKNIFYAASSPPVYLFALLVFDFALPFFLFCQCTCFLFRSNPGYVVAVPWYLAPGDSQEPSSQVIFLRPPSRNGTTFFFLKASEHSRNDFFLHAPRSDVICHLFSHLEASKRHFVSKRLCAPRDDRRRYSPFAPRTPKHQNFATCSRQTLPPRALQ